MLRIDGVKSLPRVSWGQPEANLLKMPYGYQGSTRGQLKCVGPSNVANATEHYAAVGALVYITKISKSGWVCGGVYVCVCVYLCPAMHFAMLRRIELKLGMGLGDGLPRFVGIFSKGPHLGSKVIQGSICPRNALWLPNLVRTPDQSIVHCWGQRSCRGQFA